TAVVNLTRVHDHACVSGSSRERWFEELVVSAGIVHCRVEPQCTTEECRVQSAFERLGKFRFQIGIGHSRLRNGEAARKCISWYSKEGLVRIVTHFGIRCTELKIRQLP